MLFFIFRLRLYTSIDKWEFEVINIVTYVCKRNIKILPFQRNKNESLNIILAVAKTIE